MASTQAKAVRKADALRRLSESLNIQPADLHASAKGDSELATIMTLERIADALEASKRAVQRGDLRGYIQTASDDELIAIPGIGEKSLEQVREWAAQEPAETPQTPQDEPEGDKATKPPVTVETVQEEPLRTVETVEIKPADEAPKGKRK